MAKKTDTDDASLKRLGGGRWQTRDERFTIEPQSGTWVIVDAEQTDDLGLPRVRGPFASLSAAREAIASARVTEPAASPLEARVARFRDRPAATTAATDDTGVATGRPATKPAPAENAKATASPPKSVAPTPPEPPAEPAWLLALEATERRRARELLERLTKAGAPDPEGMTRRDVVGDVPAAAAFAVGRALADLGRDATPAEVAAAVADGAAADVGVRWRLVDGDGRPILLDLRRLRSR